VNKWTISFVYSSPQLLYLDYVNICFQREQKKLAKVLDCAEKLDTCKLGVIIDVDMAIQEAKNVDVIVELW